MIATSLKGCRLGVLQDEYEQTLLNRIVKPTEAVVSCLTPLTGCAPPPALYPHSTSRPVPPGCKVCVLTGLPYCFLPGGFVGHFGVPLQPLEWILPVAVVVCSLWSMLVRCRLWVLALPCGRVMSGNADPGFGTQADNGKTGIRRSFSIASC